MKHKILIYPAMHKEKANRIKNLLEDQYDIEILEDNKLNQRIGFLFGLEDFDATTQETLPSFTFDMMILPVMEQAQIQELSKLLKANAMDIERKAMLTQHNKHWKLCDLLVEVDEEHTYFQTRAKLNNLLFQATKIKPEDILENLTSSFQKAVLDAYDTLQNQDSTTAMFENAYTSLYPLYHKIQESITRKD